MSDKPTGRAIRYKKRKATRCLPFDAKSLEAEPGDLMVDACIDGGRLYRLEQPSGRNAAAAGHLYPRTIKPPSSSMRAVLRENEVYWVEK